MKKYPTRAELQANLLLSQTPFRYLTQVVFGFYIIDFVIPQKLLAIEVDGSSHDNKEEYDARRDAFIKESGLKILHIKNEELYNLISLVCSYENILNFSEIYKTCVTKAECVYEDAARPKRKSKHKKRLPNRCRKKKIP